MEDGLHDRGSLTLRVMAGGTSENIGRCLDQVGELGSGGVVVELGPDNILQLEESARHLIDRNV